jgi:hypothetical protein
VRLWAVQLRVPCEHAGTGFAYPQVIVEAGDVNEAAERAKERLQHEKPNITRPEGITVQATAEISLDNIWLFNDERFRNVD